MTTLAPSFLNGSSSFVGNKDFHKRLNEFDFLPHPSTSYRVCARLFICALCSPAGKGLTSWLSFVVSAVSLSLTLWYPGSGVVRDCIDS